MGGGGKIEKCVVLWSGGEGGGGLKGQTFIGDLKILEEGVKLTICLCPIL